ncbi:MAG: radical SAM protein [Nitrospinae bacterium]|jgi:anaerobic magnesium-protoporphyrin IX monomethyl ester cyclase|nr:radical SAM protein [Nitrospinota bacterium]MDA1110194.1 radical SAM protein [Nitrospinota bacterium]
MKSALIFPPQWFPSQPYLALPTLKAYLENKGHVVDQFDFNIECYEVFLSREYLTRCVEIIRHRLSQPAYTSADREAQSVYRQILSDPGYLETIFSEVKDAANVLRTEELFFQFPLYKKAFTTLKIAMKLISFAHHPSKIDLESFFMQGTPEENLAGIVSATADSVSNPYLALYQDHLLSQVAWEDYGLVGISIIHVGQVIPGLTLARLLRKQYPNLHIVIGGSVFARHQDIMEDKQALFEEFFHSIILFEGEEPLDQLIVHLKENKPLSTVPNLIYMENGAVKRNGKSKALPYEQLARPTFDGLPLEKYLMPYPVLPYMASRGCYWGKCTFCTHSFIYDSYYRKDNEQRVAEDLDYLGKRYKTKYFTFSDEAISPSAFRRMSSAILSKGVQMRALGMLKFESGNVETPELFEEMHRAGFIMLFFGLESANDRILSIIDKGCDQATEKLVLKNSSDAGIWNHLYLFFGFPTEERHEAEDTIQFTVENSELGTGIIHSVGQSTFALEKDSAVYHNPAKFKIDRIIHDPDRDMAIVFDFDIQAGMPQEEVMDVYEHFNSVIQENFPSRNIWNFLSREHFLLYLDRFGKEEILNMAKDEELMTQA